MPVEPETAAYDLMQSDPHIIAVAVLKGKEIAYSTDNWDIRGDVDILVSSWAGLNTPFIMVSGVKYSTLTIEADRLVAMSYKGEGYIVAAKDDEHALIAYLDPDGYGLGAAMDVQRAVGTMSTQGPFINAETQMGQKSAQVGDLSSIEGSTSIDPQLQGEIKAFLDWIKEGEGLAGYVNYYLQQNNTQIISELSKIYNELRQIFGV